MNVATLRYSKAEIEKHVFLFSCLAPFSKPAADSLVTFNKHTVSSAFSLHLLVLVVLDWGEGGCETGFKRHWVCSITHKYKQILTEEI